MADERCDAAREEERPPSRLFWKHLEGRWSQERGGARGGAPPYKSRDKAARDWFSSVLVGSGRRIATGRRTWLRSRSSSKRESLVVVPGCRSHCSWLSWSYCSWSEGRSESVQSRDPASGKERLPFPPRPHRDSGENPSSSTKPRLSCRVDDTCRREARACGPRRRDPELRSPRAGRHAQGSRDFLFFWVLCNCVCVAPVCSSSIV